MPKCFSDFGVEIVFDVVVCSEIPIKLLPREIRGDQSPLVPNRTMKLIEISLLLRSPLWAG